MNAEVSLVWGDTSACGLCIHNSLTFQRECGARGNSPVRVSMRLEIDSVCQGIRRIWWTIRWAFVFFLISSGTTDKVWVPTAVEDYNLKLLNTFLEFNVFLIVTRI